MRRRGRTTPSANSKRECGFERTTACQNARFLWRVAEPDPRRFLSPCWRLTKYEERPSNGGRPFCFPLPHPHNKPHFATNPLPPRGEGSFSPRPLAGEGSCPRGRIRRVREGAQNQPRSHHDPTPGNFRTEDFQLPWEKPKLPCAPIAPLPPLISAISSAQTSQA